MSTTLELDRMTLEEKLQAMEALWADLSRNPENMPVPDWHKEILDGREKAVKEGKAAFLPLASVKNQIADEIRKYRIS